MLREVNVGWPVGSFMRLIKRAGFTLPLPFKSAIIFYWLKRGEKGPSKFKRVHERTHCAQIRRMGSFRFVVAYVYEAVRYMSLHDGPLEKEAYQSEHTV